MPSSKSVSSRRSSPKSSYDGRKSKTESKLPSSKNRLKNTALQKFLDEYRTADASETITHTSMGAPFGSYNIPQDKMDEFYAHYVKEVFKNKGDVHLVERHENLSPLYIDIDLKYKKTTKRQFTVNHIREIIKMYVAEIMTYFDILDTEEQLTAYVAYRDNPYVEEKSGGERVIKDGLHIIFPNIISQPWVQFQIRKNIIEKAKKAEIFTQMQLADKRHDNIVDEKVIKNSGVLMLGSSKGKGVQPYRLQRVFFGEDAIEENIDDYKESIAVRTISIRGKYNATALNESIRAPVTQESSILSGNQPVKQQILNESDSSNIENLGRMLSAERLTDYDTWVRVGICLYNLDPSKQMLTLWDKLSQEKGGSSYSSSGNQTCAAKWHSFSNSEYRTHRYNLRTLHKWAKHDSPELYEEYMAHDIRNILEKSFDAQDFDIAKVVYELYKYDYACIPTRHGAKWYEFIDHRWRESEGIFSLKFKISTQLVDHYSRLVSLFNDEAEKSSEDDIDFHMERAKRFSNIILQLKNSTFKDKIIKSCIEWFSRDPKNKNFIDKLDQNPELICFENGVYDLKERKFRDGEPDDYISLSTKINFVPLSEDDKHVADIMKFIEQILPNEAVRYYFLKLLASCLRGDSTDQLFHFLTGSGGNGKSKIMDLMENILGDYACTLPIAMLTTKRPSSTVADPATVGAKGRRLAKFDEPDDGDKINIGLFKNYSGGDTLKARDLYAGSKDTIEFKLQANLFLICNDKPEVPPHGTSVWRRIRVIEFVSEFTDKPDPKKKYQFKADDKLDEKLKIWAETFAAILIERYYPLYCTEGIKGKYTPEEVMKACREYQKDNDTFGEFLEDFVEETDDKTDTIEITTLLGYLKDWIQTQHVAVRAPNRKAFQKYLRAVYNKKTVDDKFMNGYRLKERVHNDERDDDEEESEPSVFANDEKTKPRKEKTSTDKTSAKSGKKKTSSRKTKAGNSDKNSVDEENSDGEQKAQKKITKHKKVVKSSRDKKQPKLDFNNISDTDSEKSSSSKVKKPATKKPKIRVIDEDEFKETSEIVC